MLLTRSTLTTLGVTLAALVLALPYPPDPAALVIGAAVVGGMVLAGSWAAARAGFPHARSGAANGLAARYGIPFGIGLGLGVAALLLLRFGIAAMEPRILERLARDAAVPLWQWGIILFHAPVLEEVGFRLFMLSLAAWGISRFARFRTSGGGASAPALTLASWLAALAFAAVHLPAWYQAGGVTTTLLAAVVGLNLIPGLVFGRIYIRAGLASAILAHLGADIGVHLGGRLLS